MKAAADVCSWQGQITLMSPQVRCVLCWHLHSRLSFNASQMGIWCVCVCASLTSITLSFNFSLISYYYHSMHYLIVLNEFSQSCNCHSCYYIPPPFIYIHCGKLSAHAIILQSLKTVGRWFFIDLNCKFIIFFKYAHTVIT